MAAEAERFVAAVDVDEFFAFGEREYQGWFDVEGLEGFDPESAVLTSACGQGDLAPGAALGMLQLETQLLLLRIEAQSGSNLKEDVLGAQLVDGAAGVLGLGLERLGQDLAPGHRHQGEDRFLGWHDGDLADVARAIHCLEGQICRPGVAQRVLAVPAADGAAVLALHPGPAALENRSPGRIGLDDEHRVAPDVQLESGRAEAPGLEKRVHDVPHPIGGYTAAGEASLQPSGYFARNAIGGIARTDDDGHATLRHMPAGVPLELEAERAGRVVYTAAEPVTLEPGPNRELRIDLNLGTILSGFLRESNGRPLADQELWLVPALERGPGLFASEQCKSTHGDSCL